MDSTACNYDETATESGSCSYPEAEWLDCDGNCLNDSDGDGICDDQDECEGEGAEPPDCAGVCGGSAVVDECGVCGGSGADENGCCGSVIDEFGCGCGASPSCHDVVQDVCPLAFNGDSFSDNYICSDDSPLNYRCVDGLPSEERGVFNMGDLSIQNWFNIPENNSKFQQYQLSDCYGNDCINYNPILISNSVSYTHLTLPTKA